MCTQENKYTVARELENGNVMCEQCGEGYKRDGHYKNSCGDNYISIAMANEVENTKKVSQYFTKVGLPAPSNYNIQERKDGSKRCSASWTVKDSKKLFNYMNKPLPDFYYKWPEEYRD